MYDILKDKSKYTNRILASDIECRGFIDKVNSAEDVWCIVSRDLETDEVFIFHDYPEYDNTEVVDQGTTYKIPPRTGDLITGVRFWYLAAKNGSKLSVHNCATYDSPVISKIWNKCVIPQEAWHDTFIQSKIQFFDRPQKKGSKSPHGLLNYSLMQGHKKPSVEDFTVMNGFMLHRCIVDTQTQAYCHKYLEEEARKLKESAGIDFTEAYHIEYEYAVNCHKQEQRGVLADREHIERCVEEWDVITESLAEEVEPLLPPTVKASTRITRSELMKILGYSKIPPDVMEIVKKDGKYIEAAIKPYYKPSTNFHKVEKMNVYSGFNISHGYSPEFHKKTEFTTWRNENYPKSKPSEWEVDKTVTEKKVLNKNTCDYFGVEPTDTDIIVGAFTRVSFSASKLTQHEVVKGYLIRHAGLKSVAEWNVKKDSDGQMVRAEEDMVVSYPKKAAPEHQLHYTVKKRQPIVTSPKVQEEDYEQLTGDIGEKIGRYNTLVHRRRFLSNPKDPEEKGLLSFLRDDNRLPAGVNNFGTSTGRASHRKWVNAAGVGALMGEEIRSCLIAPEGRRLVGCDMKSAQLAIAAFFANNSEYYDAIASGQEEVDDESFSSGKRYVGQSAHCHSARNFGLVTQQEFEEAVRTQDEELLHKIMLARKGSKSGSFGVIFGCSGNKLAGMLGISEHLGNEKKNNFLQQMGLDPVINWLKSCKEKFPRGRGWYVPLPFGYWAYCTSDHKSLNYVVQGMEAVCQKIAINWFNREIEKTDLDGFQVLDYHKQHCGFTQ